MLPFLDGVLAPYAAPILIYKRVHCASVILFYFYFFLYINMFDLARMKRLIDEMEAELEAVRKIVIKMEKHRGGSKFEKIYHPSSSEEEESGESCEEESEEEEEEIEATYW